MGLKTIFINYAHRGASQYYPENTMSSFYAGLKMGANGIETDVQKTKDGILVLFHDDCIDRATDGKGNLRDYTYRELLAFNIYNPARDKVDKIVAFEDFLKYFSFRDLTFAIELKQEDIEKEVVDMLEAFNMRDKTILTSFNYESIKRAKAYNPGYRVGLLYGADEPNPIGKLRAIDGEELCPLASILDKDLIERYHKMDFSVRPWGIQNEEIMERMFMWGVDGMTVNFPDRLTALMQKEVYNCQSGCFPKLK